MTGQNERGIAVLRLLARGMLRPDIAKVLGLSQAGVRSRANRIYAELGARNATHAVVIAAIDGLLTPADLRAAYEDRRTAGEGEERA
jgi:DNA-binding NarL/FixJ family response regulator